MMIVFLGPDGCGKSSVIECLIDNLPPFFSKVEYIHLRPNIFFQKKNKILLVADPHACPPRGAIMSILKIFYFLFDYTFGYLVRIRPLLNKSYLVIFDRYYHDLLVDPKRYRYGGPLWLIWFCRRFIPKPNLIILLDAPPDVLQSRKQEVSYEETRRQRKAYLNLVQGMSNGVVINASQPLEKVVADTKQAIVSYLSKKRKHLES